MLIVTEQAESRAQRMLESLSGEPSGWRCLHLKPMQEIALGTGAVRALVVTFQKFLSALPASVFFSGLGHVWAVYKNELPPSQIAQMLSELRGHFTGDTLTLEGIYHYDLKTSLGQVLAKIEKLLMPISAQAQKPNVALLTGTVSERLTAFLHEIPAGTQQQLATQRHQRKETVVLAVEDDPFYGRLIDKVLSAHARVIVAAQADQVMEEYVISAPDIVLMDIGLPDISGHQLLKAILTLDPDAYVVMASGNSFKDDVVGAMTQGAKGFITKPFSREKIIRAVNQSPTVKRQIV